MRRAVLFLMRGHARRFVSALARRSVSALARRSVSALARRLVSALALGGLTLVGASVAQERFAGPWYPTDEEIGLGREVLRLLNDARAADGLPRLASNAELEFLAYQHSREMALRGIVTHYSQLFGVGTQTRMKLAFPEVRQFGENVAVNGGALELHEALLASRGHRTNRMDAAFTHAGIAVSRSGPHRLFLTELFVRTLDESVLDGIDLLYNEAAPEDLPRDEPVYGEVSSEVIRIGSPRSDNPEYWTRLGIEDFDAGRYTGAVSDFRRALELQPGYDFARFNLARALLATGDTDEALGILTEYVKRYPDDIDAWSSIGTASLLRQEYAAAEEAFRRVLESRPRDAGGWYNLGLSLEMQGRLPDAEAAFQQALHLDSSLQQARLALSRIRG